MANRENRNTEFDGSQHWVELNKVYNWKDKPAGWQLELQYIFKSKKKALNFLNKIDSRLSKEMKNR